jgi:phage antirepressor YoqD-like protein
VSGYEVKLRKAIISRWKELENQVSSQFTIPSTFSEALQLAADQAKTIEQQTLEIEKQAAQIEQDKPKVDFANVISNTPATCKVEEFAKAMGTGRNTLFSWLRNQKILQLSNAPYQQYIDSGYFVYDEKEPYKVNENIKTYFITLITGKGQVWLEKKMQEKGYFSGK